MVARSLPMLFIGTIAGVFGEALNRKRLLVTQLFVMAASSAVLCALAFSAEIRVWHIAVGVVVAGIVWAMELAVRRRMIGEGGTPDQVAPAVAFDSLTSDGLLEQCQRLPHLPLVGGRVHRIGTQIEVVCGRFADRAVSAACNAGSMTPVTPIATFPCNSKTS